MRNEDGAQHVVLLAAGLARLHIHFIAAMRTVLSTVVHDRIAQLLVTAGTPQ